MGNMQIVRQNQGTIANAQSQAPNMLPADLAAMVDFLQPVVSRFRDNSTPQQVMLDQQTFKIGNTTTFRIASTGLGDKVMHKVTGSVALQNTAAGAQVVSLSPEFPYNLLNKVDTQINGNTSVSSGRPFVYLLEMARRFRGLKLDPVSPRLCSVTAGAGATLTAGSGTLCGYTSVSIAAASTGYINFTFYFVTPYTLNKDTLLGLLPLQNSATFATVTYTSATAMLGADQSTPFYVAAGVPGTLTHAAANSTLNILPRYDFWTVHSDSSLYQEMIMNSFQIIEMPSNILAATGPNALKMQFPLNSLLLAATLIVRNATNQVVNADSVFSNLRMEYNSNMTPFKSDVGIHEADQFLQYLNSDFATYGVLLWDGTATSDYPNVSDSTGWIDLYNTSNPAIIADVINAGITLPATYSFVRTQLVPSDVSVVPA